MNPFTAEAIMTDVRDRLYRAEALYLRLIQAYQDLCSPQLFDDTGDFKPKNDLDDCLQAALDKARKEYNQQITQSQADGADVEADVRFAFKPDPDLRERGTVEWRRAQAMQDDALAGDMDKVREHTDWYLSCIDTDQIADSLNEQIRSLNQEGKQHSIGVVLKVLSLNPNTKHQTVKIMRDRYCTESYPIGYYNHFDRSCEYTKAAKALQLILRESDLSDEYVLSQFSDEIFHLGYEKSPARGSRNKNGPLDIVVFKSKVENRLSFALVEAICAYIFLEGDNDQIAIAQAMLASIKQRAA